MINNPLNSSVSNAADGLAIDANSINGLRSSAKQNSPEALKGAAKQFEAMFLNMVMKSMRDATPQDGPFDNQQTKMFTSMLDQQMSQNLAQRGVGLADVLIRQLSNSLTKPPGVQDEDGMPLPIPLANGLLNDADKARLVQQGSAAPLTTRSRATSGAHRARPMSRRSSSVCRPRPMKPAR